MPDFPIVDAHVHLYDPASIDYPWMSAVPTLKEPHLPAHFFAANAPVEVDALVFVEVDAAPGRHLEEAAFIEGLATSEPRIRGMVCSLPLDRGDAVTGDLERYASKPLARGVRTLIERHQDDPGWAIREPFVRNVQALERYSLSFDLCLRSGQLPEATELARRCPNVRFVLDHIGKPPIRDGGLDPWRQHLAVLAAEPNVWCKISGVLTEADHAHWTYDSVAPYVAHAIECFGFDRVLYGGDWPVSRLASSYADWVDVVDRVVSDCSADELHRLYRRNAEIFYRLVPD